MKMKYWEARSFPIALKPGTDSRLNEVSGIVVGDQIGVHRDSMNGCLHLTELSSGKRFQNQFYDLGLAVKEAQRLASEGYPADEVE